MGLRQSVFFFLFIILSICIHQNANFVVVATIVSLYP